MLPHAWYVKRPNMIEESNQDCYNLCLSQIPYVGKHAHGFLPRPISAVIDLAVSRSSMTKRLAGSCLSLPIECRTGGPPHCPVLARRASTILPWLWVADSRDDHDHGMSTDASVGYLTAQRRKYLLAPSSRQESATERGFDSIHKLPPAPA